MPIDAKKPYDDSNIFARILRGELPAKRVLESEHSLAFHDVNPLAPIHVLVIPKGAYVSWDDFTAKPESWPALPLEAWQDTYTTLHRWAQIVHEPPQVGQPRVVSVAIQADPDRSGRPARGGSLQRVGDGVRADRRRRARGPAAHPAARIRPRRGPGPGRRPLRRRRRPRARGRGAAGHCARARAPGRR